MSPAARFLVAAFLLGVGDGCWAQAPAEDPFDPFGEIDDYDPLDGVAEISDPLELWNRLVFRFNDRFYYFCFRPFARGYNRVVPEPLQEGFDRAVRNLKAPVRLVNTLAQGKVKSACVVVARFALNTTFGLAGIFDVANDSLDLAPRDEDTAQTLGRYGVGPGFYIVWPFIGPSTVRETAGIVADQIVLPAIVTFDEAVWLGISAGQYVNDEALHLGRYERLTDDAVEPYAALRSAYIQHRQSLIDK